MSSNAIVKINKIGRAGEIIALIMKILLGIALAGSIIGFIAVMVLPEDFVTVKMNGSADININVGALGVELPADKVEESILNGISEDSSVSFNNATMEITDVNVTDSDINIQTGGQLSHFSMRSCAYAILVGAVYIILMLVTVVFAGFLAKAFANCTSPFDEDIIRKMKNFAYSLIPWTFAACITDNVMRGIFISRNTSFNLSIKLSAIFGVLIVLALAYIFQYGAELQRESDETL